MDSRAPPPWEALPLVAEALDPKSLASASCVSKQWRAAMSADHLWRPLLLSARPSALRLPDAGRIPHRALFALLRSASSLRRRGPSPPLISLTDLIFIVDVFELGAPVFSIAKPGEEVWSAGVFHFEFEVAVGDSAERGAPEELRVAWTVVAKGYGWAFAMMEGVGKGRRVGGSGFWFSEPLPGPACCGVEGSGMVAEMGLELVDGRVGARRVVRVKMGIMGASGCRYVGLDEGLLYLQSFLQPSCFQELLGRGLLLPLLG